MSSLSELMAFDKFRLKDVWNQLRDDPWRILTGVDPVSTWLNNKILGRDDEPLGNLWGGPSRQQFRRAEESGIDVKPRKFADAVAAAVILSQGGGGGAEGASAGGGASGSGISGFSGLGATGTSTSGTASGFGALGAPGTAVGGTASGFGALAAPGTAAGGTASGFGAMGAGGGGSAAPTGGNSFMDQLQQQRPSLGGQQQQTGNSALDTVNMIRLMAEIQRLEAQRAVEEQRKRFGGF